MKKRDKTDLLTEARETVKRLAEARGFTFTDEAERDFAVAVYLEGRLAGMEAAAGVYNPERKPEPDAGSSAAFWAGASSAGRRF